VGYWQNARALNPWNSNPAFGIAYMYDTLFGVNFKNNPSGDIIPVIGTSYSWGTNTSECTVTLNSAAKWNNGSAVTAEDVVFSYKLAMTNSSNFGSDMTAQLKDVVKVDATHVKFITKPTTNRTQFLDIWLTSNVPIVNMGVWTEIIAACNGATNNTIGGIAGQHSPIVQGPYALDGFDNDWFNASFPAAWKVASGPYLPFYRSADFNQEIYQKQASWWGSGVIYGDLPNTAGNIAKCPGYIGMDHFASNDLQNAAFLNGEIDWFAGFIGRLDAITAAYPTINSWYEQNPPFEIGVSSMVELTLNWAFFPFNQLWFRKALAYAIDYDTFSGTYASGYLQRARQGFVDDRASSLAGIYNATVQSTYGIDYNLTLAETMLNTTGGAVYNAKEDLWYVMNTGAYTGMQNANGSYITPGQMIILGPYTSITVGGWTDVDASTGCTKGWCDAFTTKLNITFTGVNTDYGTWSSSFQDRSFQTAMMCSSPKLLLRPVAFLNGYRSAGPNYHAAFNRNTTGWNDTDAGLYEIAYQKMLSSLVDSQAYNDSADDMQLYLARDVPSIPLYGNGFWYAYNNATWIGWLNVNNAFNQVTTNWDNDNFALRERFVINLSQNPVVLPPPDLTLWFGIIAIAALVALVIAVIVMRKRGA
jgi:ABC-type transport system substrate-binding protein